jgi:Leucine-rich repeat (LRR) protein
MFLPRLTLTLYVSISTLFRSMSPGYNGLNGTLPSELYALSSLELLSIVGGNLQGTIPSSLGTLTRLDTLELAENLLTGTIPESFADLGRLDWLFMDYNELTGSIPTLVSSIKYLSLGVNYLSGTLPGSVIFESIRSMILDYNLLSGRLPESFFSPTLEYIQLGDNLFTGSLTDKIGDLLEVSYMALRNNDLTGNFPSEIGALIKLEGLYVDGNSLNGMIPSELGLLTRLRGLWLSDNQLSGIVPVELSSLSALLSLRLFANNLTGSMDMFCNKTDLFAKIITDCSAADGVVDTTSSVECPCCSSCCDSLTGNCTVNAEASCLVEKAKFEGENSPSYYESGGTVCECTNGSDDDSNNNNNNSTTTISLSCRDTQCQSCNQNGTVCSVNEHYQYFFDETGHPRTYRSTFQYVVGRNDTVTIEYTIQEDFTRDCEVTVNGQLCNKCVKDECEDLFAGVFVDCENVKEAGSVDLCNPKPGDTEGPLAVFAFQDPVFLQGCPPRFFGLTPK